jgi:hypothetical protein
MKSLLLALLIVPSVSCSEPFDDWDDTDRNLAAAALVIGAIDMGQTIEISNNCHNNIDRFERNPILGRCPEKHQVYKYFIASAIFTIAAADALPADYRKLWLGSAAAYELYFVGRNINIGIGVRF